MSLILTIDTATAQASVSLALNGKVLQQCINSQSMDHAGWIHSAIKELMLFNAGIYTLNDIQAIAVVAGPGSYTGVRVGMATAKGLCYALDIPLISLNTLTVLAHATKQNISSSLLFCPMLDARRMEVFTALYDDAMQELLPPCAMILEPGSFSAWLDKHTIVFSGSGSYKWKEMVQHENALFKDVFYTPDDIALMANDSFTQHAFSGLAYTEPIYLKDFYSYQKQKTV